MVPTLSLFLPLIVDPCSTSLMTSSVTTLIRSILYSTKTRFKRPIRRIDISTDQPLTTPLETIKLAPSLLWSTILSSIRTTLCLHSCLCRTFNSYWRKVSSSNLLSRVKSSDSSSITMNGPQLTLMIRPT